MNRRGFITSLGAMVGLVAAEPVRRYWAVGANLSRSHVYTWDSIEMTIGGRKFIQVGDHPPVFDGPYFHAPTPFDQAKADAQQQPESLSDAFGFDWDKHPDGSRVGSQRLNPPGWSDAMQFNIEPGKIRTISGTIPADSNEVLRFLSDHGDVFKA